MYLYCVTYSSVVLIGINEEAGSACNLHGVCCTGQKKIFLNVAQLTRQSALQLNIKVGRLCMGIKSHVKGRAISYANGST